MNLPRLLQTSMVTIVSLLLDKHSRNEITINALHVLQRWEMVALYRVQDLTTTEIEIKTEVRFFLYISIRVYIILNT